MQHTQAVPPLPIARGFGPWLEDFNGQRYFDATSSWWVNLFGHADPQLNAAIHDQLDTLPHVMLAGCTHAPAVELAQRLSQRTHQVLGHCFFASDGASAVEIALKQSMHYWRNGGHSGKQSYVYVQGGYHGETLGALAVTDVPVFRSAYAPLLMPAHSVPSPDARRAQPGQTATEVALEAAQALEQILSTHHAHIAAVIIEPMVQCAGGMAMHDAQYLKRVRALCDHYQVHLIADEIATGCGRTGTFFACEHAGIWPDFLCLSKGISGGLLPLSLVLSRPAIYEAFLDDDVARGFLHSHSYSGNALACRAALAVLDRFEQDDVLVRNQTRAACLTEALAPIRHDARIEHFRTLGMIWAFDVPAHWAGERFAQRFHMAGRAHGLLIRPIGHTVYLMPPYVLDADLCAWLAERMQQTINTVLNNPGNNHAARNPEPAVA